LCDRSAARSRRGPVHQVKGKGIILNLVLFFSAAKCDVTDVVAQQQRSGKNQQVQADDISMNESKLADRR
jgi:hypothetical protein